MAGSGSTVQRSAARHWRQRCWRAWLVLALAGASLSACASASEKLAGTLSEAPGIGLPDGAPARPASAPAYPAVHDMPPPRAAAVLSPLEQQKLEDDLVAARDQQQAAAGPRGRKPPPKPAATPVASRRAIY
jgi:hypothetical protein